MPNWCDNALAVTGTKWELDRFEEYVESDSQCFAFESILPMPDDLHKTTSPAHIVSAEEYDSIDPKEWAEMCNPENPFKSKPITQEVSDRYKELYGANNWYDWCWDNWGTKWETDDPKVDKYYVENGQKFDLLAYEFTTAWSPPIAIVTELAKQFPTLELTLDWSEEGGLAGNIRAKSGTIYEDKAWEVQVGELRNV